MIRRCLTTPDPLKKDAAGDFRPPDLLLTPLTDLLESVIGCYSFFISGSFGKM